MNSKEISDEIEVIYNEGDFRALYRATRRHKTTAILLLVVIPGFFAIVSFLDGVRGVGLFYHALPYIFIVLIVLVFFYYYLPWASVRARRKTGWGEAMRLRLTDEGVAVQHATQDSLFFWTKIVDVVVHKSRLFVFTSPGCAIILPRRFFSDDDHFFSWAKRAKQLWQSAKAGS